MLICDYRWHRVFQPMFDMVIFYAGAYSCEGNITFSEEEQEKEGKSCYIMTNSSVR